MPHFDARVLAVEDNPVNQELVRLLLENLGCRVTLANNGQEAVEVFTNTPLDDLYDPVAVILMDLQMPVMDGFAATAAIRAHEAETDRHRHIPIIALTANALEGDRERCLEARMDDYLTKPFTQRQLADTLTRWLPTTQMGDTIELPQSAIIHTPSSEREPMTEILDYAALERITALQRAGAPSILGRVIELYLDSAPKNMASIRASIEPWNPSQLEHAAHSLKSSSANVGARTVSEYCRQLELMGRELRETHARETLVALEKAYAAASRALREEMAKV
jgi:CheY-like chemotaxis protein/HPt (histidine-containing phosphotransfer) domain-containing protein